jgi:hypothetical protein
MTLCIVDLDNELYKMHGTYIKINSGVMLFLGTRVFWCRMFKGVANTEFVVISKEGLL